ncbi:MAG: fumarate reductase/succinate dehydrogenase flavoprotein-like protein [Burkholderiales bacterium]|nr:fumarate reductase/succinate dehydrogenase flavoprotein-like protein [Burkholderiales bacterium]
MDRYDVVVVGAGNAAFCAALAAREKVQKVLVLERAPEDEAGGNSRFTAGLMRVAYRGVEDLKQVIPDLTEEEIARTDFGAYTEEQFLDDMARRGSSSRSARRRRRTASRSGTARERSRCSSMTRGFKALS